jgi:ribosome-binding protein aMBF1 (putative translation factor)
LVGFLLSISKVEKRINKNNIYVLCIENIHTHFALVQFVKDEKYLKALGKRIRSLREAKQMTQLDLGLLCNNHAEQIGRIERGQHNVTICSLLYIAKALEISVSELLDFN